MEREDLLLGWPFESRTGETSQLRRRGETERVALANAQRYDKQGHLITFAPTGAGKGVSVIIPNLLHYPGAVIVIDPKGENFAVTARYRQEVLGQKIVLLDPFERVDIDSPSIAPLGIERGRLSPLEIDDDDDYTISTTSTTLAELLAGEEGSFTQDPYWSDQGKVLIAGLIAHEMSLARRQGRRPVLRKVVDALFPPDGRETTAELHRILNEEEPAEFARQSIGSITGILADTTRTSVLSQAKNQLRILIPRGITNALEDSTIQLEEIREGTKYTIYIVIPPNKLVSHRPLLRIWVGLILDAVMQRSKQTVPSTLFLLDECAQLGELSELRSAVTLLRGYGLRVWMFFQDFTQVARLYAADHMTLINNCGVLQAFGATRHGAAEPIGDIVGGNKTIRQLMSLDPQQQLLSIAGQSVRTMRLMKYYEDPAFKGRFDPNPLHPDEPPSRGNRPFFPNNHYKIHY